MLIKTTISCFQTPRHVFEGKSLFVIVECGNDAVPTKKGSPGNVKCEDTTTYKWATLDQNIDNVCLNIYAPLNHSLKEI